MTVIQVSGRELQADPGRTIAEIVSDNGLHPDSYLYLIDGKPVPMDTILAEDTVVRAVRVASGG